MSSGRLKILCLGDVVARPGRSALRLALPELRKRYAPDLVIVNGENASGGTGLDAKTAHELHELPVDLITLGDHTWKYKDLRPLLDEVPWCIRPNNYPSGAPGKGWAVLPSVKGVKVGVMNLIGRTFINGSFDCPFQAARQLLSNELSSCDFVVCDLHAEATSEKLAFAREFDSKIGLLYGTHTHVQTADAQVLPGGTGYISDLGMCGSHAGVIGMDQKTAIGRFVTGLPSAYRAASGMRQLNGVFASFDPGKKQVERVEAVHHEVPD